MFCRYCGKKVHDDSMFCSFCGKRLIFETDSPNDTRFESDPEFVWDLHEFPEHKQTSEIDFDWTEEEIASSDLESDAEIIPETELRLRLEQEPEREQINTIDKFYTFNRKNEEFQRLLDREYEKVKTQEDSEEDSEEFSEPEAEVTPEPEAAPEAEATPAQKEIPEPEDAPEEESIIFDNETIVKRFDTKEFNKDLIESALEKAGVKSKEYELSLERDIYESDFKPRFVDDDEAEYKQDYEEEPVAEGAVPESPVYEPSYDEEIVDREALLETQKQEAFKALEELWDSPDRRKSKYIDKADSESEEKEGKTEGKARKVILCILAILLALQISFIGIRVLAPESGAAAFITEYLGFTTNWLGDFRQTPTLGDGTD